MAEGGKAAFQFASFASPVIDQCTRKLRYERFGPKYARMSTVLVTGGSGFVGGHVILQLLHQGHSVRTTIRSAKREEDVRKALGRDGINAERRLVFFTATLEREGGWKEAVQGCDFVIHVASPLPITAPKTEDEVIVPARDGVLRVLKVARDAGVKRVVLTSSCGAIYYGLPPRDAPFDETNWSNLDGEMSAYVKSKVIAERAAWDFIGREGGALELSVINPSGIFGPLLAPGVSSSPELIKRVLRGGLGNPRIYFGVVDVRDVADLHLRAMTHPAAKGERFIAVSGRVMSMPEIARVLKARLGSEARRVSTRTLPSWFVRMLAPFNGQLRPLLPLLDVIRQPTSAKAERLLDWKPRAPEEAVVATAESLVRLGMVLGSAA